MYGRRRRPVRFLGRSKPREAQYAGTCAGCQRAINPGEMFCFDDEPMPKSRYHEGCETIHSEETAPPEPEARESTEAVPNDWSTDQDEETAPPPEPEAQRPTTPRDESIDRIIDRRIQLALGSFKPSEAVTADRARAMVDDKIKHAMDEDSIRAMIAKLVAPRETTLEIRDPTGGKAVKIKNAHWLLPRVVKLVAAGFHVYLWGGAGGGKTTAAQQIAEALRRDYEMDTLDQSTFKSAVQGFKNAAGKNVDTPFLRAYIDGMIYIAEELDCAPATVQNLFNTALANGHTPTAWGKEPRGSKFAFVGNGNSPGRPTPEFPERKVMGAAFKDRLYFVQWPQDESIENRAAGLPCEPPPIRVAKTCTPVEWVTWVKTIRAWAKRAQPTLCAHTGQRASLLGLDALKIGESPEEVAHALIFKGADATIVEKALSACPLPGREI